MNATTGRMGIPSAFLIFHGWQISCQAADFTVPLGRARAGVKHHAGLEFQIADSLKRLLRPAIAWRAG